MASIDFTNRVSEVIESVRCGILLSEAPYQEILDLAPASSDESNLEVVALAVRHLGELCDWHHYRCAEQWLEQGISSEDLHLEVRLLNEGINKHEDADRRSPEYQATIRSIGEGFREIKEVTHRLFRAARDVETLMGFDQEVTDRLVATLGTWDKSAVPENLLDLLPEEVKFPLRRPIHAGPYDHRLHLLVQVLVSRLGETGCSKDAVIKQCGHVIADVLHAADEDATNGLVLKQATLLAEEFVRSESRGVVGLCWRGQLARIEGDDDLAIECANRVWKMTANASPKSVNQVISFFALAQRSDDWSSLSWHRLDYAQSQLSEIEASWIDVKERLASAMLRRAARKGTWDTSLLCSAFVLHDDGFYLEPNDVPSEWWVWMSEHIDHSNYYTENYYTYWNGAFAALGVYTDPRLAHNALAVLLAALLFNKSKRIESPSIQELLSSLSELHGAGTMPEKKKAALEMVKHIYREKDLGNLTAAYRLAITKALEDTMGSADTISMAEPSSDESSQSSSKPINPTLLNQAEVYLKTQISEATWAKVSSKAKNDYKHGEFMYIMASRSEGELGNFDSFVMHYSNGLLADIHESLRGPLFKNKAHKREFLAVFGKDYPEWPELLRFLDDLEKIAGTTLCTCLLSQGVALHQVRILREPFDTMRSCRNKAVHAKDRIDREQAAVLHDLLLNKGLVQKVVEYFPKVPRR